MNRTHPVFEKFSSIQSTGTGEHIFDFLGVKTNVKYKKGWERFAVTKDKKYTAKKPDVNEHYFDWIAILQSVYKADKVYRMIELGAGYGPWLARAAAACKQVDRIARMELIGVEAEEIHFNWMVEHFKENKMDPKTFNLIYGGVAKNEGVAKFIVSDNPSGNYGNALDKVNTDDNYITIKTFTLESIIDNLSGPVDLLHVDIQGTEYEIIPSSMDVINSRVKSMMIGTHTSDEKHNTLIQLLKSHEWEFVYNFPRNSEVETEFGNVHFNDGFLYLINKKFD